MPVIPNDLQKQIRRLQLRSRRIVRTSLAGEYSSAFKGTGLSFDDVREYQPGDDVRRIDWNVTARMGLPFVKRYVEERELTVLIVLDVSAAMRFGSTGITKRTVAAEVAAVVAVCAAGHNDRVGLIAASDRVERYQRPAKGGRHLLTVLRDALFLMPEGSQTNYAPAWEMLLRLHRRRAIVIVISDFLADYPSDLFRKMAHKHETIAVRITDPLEREWPDAGLVRVSDGSDESDRLIDTSSQAFRISYRQRMAERRGSFEQLCQAARADLADLSTDGQHFDQLLSYFRRRERRPVSA